MTAARLDQDFLEAFAERWWAAWNSHDGEAVAALCTDDIVNSGPALGREVRGREALVGYVDTFAQAFPDMHFVIGEPPYGSLTRPKAIVPWHFGATHDGEFTPMRLPPSGARVEVDGVDHWWFRDGQVCRRTMVYDYAQVLSALTARA